MKHLILAGGAALVLSGCATSPKQTVLDLDTTDRKWASRECVAARKAVARTKDNAATRGVIGFLGNLAAPFAGTATTLAWSAAEDPKREEMNRRVRSACISDPLAKGKGKQAALKGGSKRR